MQAGLPRLTIDGPVATLTLRRPDQANRLAPEDLAEFDTLLAAVDADDAVRVLLLRGEGRHFCSGYDLGSLGAGRRVDFGAVVDALERVRPVSIAVLHGGVYGGATDLALACDFRVGADGIEMLMPAARLGLHYYRSGLERFVSRLGLDHAKRLFLTAEKLDAAAMREIGYLTHHVPAAALEETVAALASACAAMAPLAQRGMKRHLNDIARQRLDPAALQSDIQRALDSDDLREGLAAWAEKRAPRFRGR